jgi:hypothetical protein
VPGMMRGITLDQAAEWRGSCSTHHTV